MEVFQKYNVKLTFSTTLVSEGEGGDCVCVRECVCACVQE